MLKCDNPHKALSTMPDTQQVLGESYIIIGDI